MYKKTISVATVSALTMTIASCSSINGEVSRQSWEQVLSQCGVSDFNKSEPLFFGAANANGVGSIWALDSETGDYWPRSQFTDITARSDVLFTNREFQCSGKVKDGLNFEVGANAKPVVYPVSVDVQASISSAKTAIVSVSSIVQEDAYWDRFNDEFTKLPADSSIKRGAELGNRYIVGRAWKITGFHALLTYEGDQALSAKAALDSEVATGSLDAAIKLTSNNTLEISSSQELYIAGVLRKLSPSGVAAGSGEAIGDWVPATNNAKINPPQ
ncbi:hypothetical protein [Metapseudomonas furukawaii]|uniref:hypothetical protein n=1 Tax=Metapseudomonas furukawaii TaxID=1149133 RepID=UPI00103A8533|nr:hypothetical protein [Pseudomonas furukawaii]